jgi:FkbM family methyltransferase
MWLEPAPIRQRILEHLGVARILDVGANTGQYALECFEYGFQGSIISFEPVADIFSELESNATREARWTTMRLAVGNTDGSITMNVAGTMSSALERNAAEPTAFEFKVEGAETAPATKLDSLWNSLPLPTATTWLKLDTQGYEIEALKGAEQALGEIVAVEAELSVCPFYDSQPRWDEVVMMLGRLGFELWSVKPGTRFTDSHRMAEFDAIMVNSALIS